MLSALYLVFSDEGIVEGWFFGVVDCLVDLLILSAYSLKHGFLIVGECDIAERNSVVWSVVGQ